MPSSTSRWIKEVTAGRGGCPSDEIIPARVVSAMELARGNHWRRVDSSATGLVEFTHNDLVLTANQDPFSEEPLSALTVTEGNRRLVIEDLPKRYDLPEQAVEWMRSASSYMTFTAFQIRDDPRQLTLDQLKAMPQRDLYLLCEREGSAERHQRYALSHLFTGPVRLHPYIGKSIEVDIIRNSDTRRLDVLPTADGRSSNDVFPYYGVPVHPRSRRRFALLDKPVSRMEMWPTTSMRTLYDPVNDIHVKTSMDVQVSGGPRVLRDGECRRGMTVSRLLLELLEKGLLPPNVSFLPELQWISGSDDEAFNALIRGGLQDIRPAVEPDDRIIAASSLMTRLPFTDERSLLELLIEQNGPQIYFEIVDMMITNHLQMADLGLSQEDHGQNTLFVFDKDFRRIKSIVMRDIESIYMDLDRLDECVQTKNTYPRTAASVTNAHNPDDRRRRSARFSHCVLDAQVAVGMGMMIEDGLITPQEAIRFVKEVTKRSTTPAVRMGLDGVFYRRAGIEQLLNGTRGSTHRPMNNALWGTPVQRAHEISR